MVSLEGLAHERGWRAKCVFSLSLDGGRSRSDELEEVSKAYEFPAL